MWRKFFVLSMIIIVCISCNSDIDVVNPETIESYFPIFIGDIRQLYCSDDGMGLLVEVKQKVVRKDGLDVYLVKQTVQTESGPLIADLYYGIKDGYIIQTELDTVNTGSLLKINPFNEQRLVKILPKDGDEINVTQNTNIIDSIVLKVRLIDKLVTPLKTFYNVAEYQRFVNGVDAGGRIYYSKGYGHICSIFSQGALRSTFNLRYLKLSTYEVGNLKLY